MADLVIAEGVELELRPARLASRFVAALLDILVQAALFFVFMFVSAALTARSGNIDSEHALTIVVIVLVTIGYPVLCETVSTGRSIGKAAAGLRVVRVDGGPERFRHALARALGGLFADYNLPLLGTVAVSGLSGLLICLVGLPGAIACVTSRRGQRLGDLLAGTMVVRERTDFGRGTLPTPPTFDAAAWAARATVGDVPTGLIVAGRQLISRVFELDRKAAAELAAELVQQYSAYVKPPAPPGMPTYQYLLAVTSERFRREAGTAYAAIASAAPPMPMPTPMPVAMAPAPVYMPPTQPMMPVGSNADTSSRSSRRH